MHFDAEEDAIVLRRLGGRENWLAVMKVPRESERRAASAARTAEAAEAVSWLLDTDVICQPAKKNGDPEVIAWLEVEQDRCYTSAVVIAQLAYWVRMKEGRQRQTLQGGSHGWWTGFTTVSTGSTCRWRTSGRSRSDCSRRLVSACPSRTATSRQRRDGTD